MPKKRGPKRKHGTLQPDGTIFIAKNPPMLRDNPKTRSQSAKKSHRTKLLAYMSNPDNPMPERKQYLELLGLKSHPTYLYRIFTPDEMTLMENEALALRRGGYAPKIALVDEALLRNAAETGKAAEASLVYKRFEGWQEKTTTEVTHTLKLDKELQELLNPVYRGAITVEPETETRLLPESI